jgi:hypothetical protein
MNPAMVFNSISKTSGCRAIVIELENKIIDYLTAGGLLSRGYLLGELREAIAKMIDPACENAKALLFARWYNWHPGEEHPDGRDDMDHRGDHIRR